jgi:hypothetical protein
MPKSLSAIYGADDNAFAESIASDALTSGAGSEDIWGAVEDARAQSQANVGKESLGPSDPKTPVTSRANKGSVDYPNDTKGAHSKGPSSATSTGGRDSLVPSNQKAKNGAQRSPAYTNEVS